jgi:hypothetical protein
MKYNVILYLSAPSKYNVTLYLATPSKYRTLLFLLRADSLHLLIGSLSAAANNNTVAPLNDEPANQASLGLRTTNQVTLQVSCRLSLIRSALLYALFITYPQTNVIYESVCF